jgi:hypothetical protein
MNEDRDRRNFRSASSGKQEIKLDRQRINSASTIQHAHCFVNADRSDERRAPEPGGNGKFVAAGGDGTKNWRSLMVRKIPGSLLALGIAGALAVTSATPAFAQSSSRHMRHQAPQLKQVQPRSGSNTQEQARAANASARSEGGGPGGQCWYSEGGGGHGTMGYWEPCGKTGGAPNR